MKFYSYGACKEVTGSKHFIEIDNQIIQIDCGMFQGRRKESYLKNKNIKFNPKVLSALILTHAHFDHCGAIPYIIKNGFAGNVYSTPATRDVSNIILLDSAYIQQKDFEYLKEKKQKHPERNINLYEPLYNSDDVIKALGHFVTINYHRDFFISRNIKIKFYDAGHILGSSLVYIETNEGNIVFTGDLGRKHLPIIKDPETLPDFDFLVIEGTYGNRLHESIGLAKENLAKVINRAVNRNGKIIIPAFTIERTQELIYIIHTLILEKNIPEIPIFIDSPMAVNATSVFKLHPECFDEETINNFTSEKLDPFGFDSIRYVSSTSQSKKINEIQEPIIIISASGMCETGRILHHLKNNIEDPANIIAIVGYMAENTLGRKILDGAKKIKIFNKTYTVRAEVVKLNAFSGHADYNEILDWVSYHNKEKIKKVFLVHGEEEALKNLQTLMVQAGLKHVEIVEEGVQYDLN